MEEKKEAGKHPAHHEHPQEHHEIHHEIHHEGKIDNNPDKINFSKFKKNPWMPVSIILVIVVVILLVMMFIKPGQVTGAVAGNNVVEFAKSQGLQASVLNIVDKGAFYEVNLSMNNQEFPVYVTKDGKSMATGLIPLGNTGTTPTNTTTKPPQDVPKSDKPKVQGFFFAYCPYGTQFEKAMVPVYDLLKNKADIGIVFIGAMHGEYERVESLRQLCIQKNYGNDKLWKYLKAFNENTAIGACSGTDTCVNPLIQKIYTSLSIDKTKIETCMAKDAPALYDAQVQESSDLGISGSPTFVINGVQVQVNRSPDAIKQAICDSFITPPKECNQTLSSTAASAGFGASAGAAGSTTGAQC